MKKARLMLVYSIIHAQKNIYSGWPGKMSDPVLPGRKSLRFTFLTNF